MTATRIDWAERVWNPTTGCTHVSDGCDNCYAAAFAHRGLTESHLGLTTTVKRHGKSLPQWNGTVRLRGDKLGEPLKWLRWAAKFRRTPRYDKDGHCEHCGTHREAHEGYPCPEGFGLGRRPRVFVNSMSDLGHKAVPLDFFAKVIATVKMCQDIEFVVLTKRPERLADNMRAIGGWWQSNGASLPCESLRYASNLRDVPWPLPNLTLGISAENQKAYDERIDDLLRCPAARRIVSYEPALGPLDLSLLGTLPDEIAPGYKQACDLIHGVICGGESGGKARPTDLEWHRSVRDQCRSAGVAFWYKQMGRRVIDPDGHVVTLARQGRNRDEMPRDLDITEWAT